MGNKITNSQEIMEKLHNKEYQLYFANGDSRKKKMFRHVYGTSISQIWKIIQLNKQKWLFLNSTMA